MPTSLNPSLPQPGQLLAEKYRIERMIGRGGMGSVYAAVHVGTEKRCAVKWLLPERSSPEVVARFEQEARAAGRVHHPNVIQVFDVGQHEGAAFIVMELLDGEPMRATLQRADLGRAELVELLAQASAGVAAAHAEGVVHRDLKPDNLFVTRGAHDRPLLKVLDFGISKLNGEDARGVMTRSGTMVGTPLYMAPERLYGDPSDERADVYSLGVILYEALTGRVPFEGETSASLAREISRADGATPPAELDPSIDPLLSDIAVYALEADRDERLPSAQALGEQLREVLELLQSEDEPAAQSTAPMVALRAMATTLESRSPKPAPVAHTSAPPRGTWLSLAGGAALLGVVALALVGLALFAQSVADDPPQSAPVPEATGAPVVEPPPTVSPTKPVPEPHQAEVAVKAAGAAVDVSPASVVEAGAPPAPVARPSARESTRKRPLRKVRSASPSVAPPQQPAAASPPPTPGPPSARSVGRSKSDLKANDFY